MKRVFKSAAIWLLVLTLCLTVLPVKAQDESFDTRFYWLYSSAIPAAWKKLSTMQTAPVTVAVIDTGIELENPHLKNRIDPNGRNFVLSSEIGRASCRERV